jgi:hypothetical protein
MQHIEAAADAFDAAAVGALLCQRGFAVVDDFVGSKAATASMLAAIQELDGAGKMSLGKVHQISTRAVVAATTRSDRIVYLPSIHHRPSGSGATAFLGVDEVASALRAYTVAADQLRAQLSSQVSLVEHVGGAPDDCTFMCACYPGGGARYAKHRDAPPKAGRKVRVAVDPTTSARSRWLWVLGTSRRRLVLRGLAGRC